MTSDIRSQTRIAQRLLARLTLSEKVSLLSGRDGWHTVPVERLGIPALAMTDGPHGVCAWSLRKDNPRVSATCFPTGIALAATWNPRLVRQVGTALGDETRKLGYDILLGPCVNIVRTPLGGRNFETYSEDPHLAARMAVAYVHGVQSRGVGTSVKHFACNNQEHNRFRASSALDERSLREIYLPAFEAAVREAQPWTVMCAYNRVNGVYASEHRYLLTEILRDEWGFQGIVVSDWGANHTIVDSVRAGLDLEMPGPAKYYGKLLEEAAGNWQIEEEEINRAALRILRLLVRSGRLNGRRLRGGSVNTPAHQLLARRAAEEGVTLLQNRNRALPLDLRRLRRLAVIGPNARGFQTGGGGSSDAIPPYRVNPLDALRRLAGRRVAIRFEEGCSNAADLPTLSPEFCADRRGFRVEFFNRSDFSGRPVAARNDRWGLQLRVSGRPPADGVRPHGFSVRWTARLRVPETTRYRFEVKTSGRAVLFLDGRACARKNAAAELDLRKGRRYRLEVRFTARSKPEPHSLFVRFGPSPEYRAEERIRRAADLARSAGAAVVFVGMPHRFESEGHDRPHMDLPGRQNDLVRAVARACPNVVVVVNAGAPVALPWADAVNAILFAYYPGMEGGNAVARVLLGQVNPSGRLPITLPRRYEDNPTYPTYPGDREARYGEGVFVGYRWYDAARIEPLFPFGHGLSYTTFAYGRVQAPKSVRAGRTFRVTVPVTNTGGRAGQEVAQLYVRDPQSSVARPPRELRGFCKLRLAPGRTGRAVFEIGERALSFYDPVRKRWVAEPGVFELQIGPSSRDIRARHTFRLRA